MLSLYPPYSIFTYECPGDGIGIRVGLRSQILRVRVSPWAPYINILQVELDSRSNYLGIMDRIITGTGAKIRSVFLYGKNPVTTFVKVAFD